jgi:hypothetical protein
MKRSLALVALLLLAVPITAGQTYSAHPASGMIGQADAVDFNAVGETAVTITVPRYALRKLYFTACTNFDNSVVTQGGVYTETGGGGVQLGGVAVQDPDAPPNNPARLFDNLLTGVGDINLQTAWTAPTLYVRVTTPRGAAMTCDFVVVGDVLP